MQTRAWLLMLLLGALVGCATLVPAPRAPQSAEPPVEAWAKVLARFVDDRGRVDFDGITKYPRDLDQYVAWVYAVGPNNQPGLFSTREQVIAYHLNAYNALAMYNVIEAGIPTSLAGLRKASFFFLRKLQVGDEPLTLYAYENQVIRPLGEERVHFALNCMAVSCPRLPRVPFRAESLDAELDRQARFFFSEARNLRIDTATRTVWLSKILDFYTGDFLAKAPSLIAYANRYSREAIPLDYTVRFIPYDWTVNRQPQR